MLISIHALRWAAVAVAVACATVLSSTAAMAAVPRSNGLQGTPRCLTSHLRVALRYGGAAAGANYYQLRFTNRSQVTCHLSGYPGVAGVNRHGKQLGSEAARLTAFRVRLVVLRPGGTAHAVLGITDVIDLPSQGCRRTTAAGLRVFPPHAFQPTFLRFRFAACSRRGPVYLHVTAIRPGTRLP